MHKYIIFILISITLFVNMTVSIPSSLLVVNFIYD